MLYDVNASSAKFCIIFLSFSWENIVFLYYVAICIEDRFWFLLHFNTYYLLNLYTINEKNMTSFSLSYKKVINIKYLSENW